MLAANGVEAMSTAENETTSLNHRPNQMSGPDAAES